MTTPETSATIEVRDNPARSRYEAWSDGVVAGHEKYHLTEGRIAFVSTIVDEEFQGKGIASVLVAGALDDVRRRGERLVVPVCHFVQTFLRRHPDYTDLVAPEAAATE